MRLKRPGTYAPLATHYYDDPKIIEAGEEAEVLYTRMLAYASGQPEAEGVIPDAVVRFRLGLDIEVTGKGTGKGTGNGTGKGTGNRVERLEHAGLVEREGDCWRIVAWLRWNKSGAEIDRDRANDRRRKKPVTRGDTGKGTGKGTGNGTGIRTENAPDSCTPDTDTDTDTPLTNVRGVQGGDVPDVAGSHVGADAPTAPAKAKPKHKAIGTRLPNGWFPSRTPGNENAEAGHDQAWLQHELDRFRDYWAAQPGQRGRKADWDATWRNWVRKADDMGEARPRSRSATGLSDDEWQDAYRRAVARDAASADDTNSSNAPQALSLLPRSA
mgnify:CR=1 FL=1